MRAVPRLCGFYPGICLKTEEKARKNLRVVRHKHKIRMNNVQQVGGEILGTLDRCTENVSYYKVLYILRK